MGPWVLINDRWYKGFTFFLIISVSIVNSCDTFIGVVKDALNYES